MSEDRRSIRHMQEVQLLSAAEAAERLGLSDRHVGRLAAEGVIPSIRVGRRGTYLFDPAVIDEYKRERGGAKRVVRSES